jgi:hypothetical protein
LNLCLAVLMMVRSCFRPAHVAAISIAALFVPAVLTAQTYKAIGEYKILGSSANGIAADSDSRRLFVATSAGVEVLNLDTGAPGSCPRGPEAR